MTRITLSLLAFTMLFSGCATVQPNTKLAPNATSAEREMLARNTLECAQDAKIAVAIGSGMASAGLLTVSMGFAAQGDKTRLLGTVVVGALTGGIGSYFVYTGNDVLQKWNAMAADVKDGKSDEGCDPLLFLPTSK